MNSIVAVSSKTGDKEYVKG